MHTTIGGFCTRNRVLGILAVSRSFGDHGMKDFVIGNPKSIQFLSTDKVFLPCVAATPYVSETELDSCGDCPILILACDGVWDVFSDQEAADLLMDRFKKEGPFTDAAKYLVSIIIDTHYQRFRRTQNRCNLTLGAGGHRAR